MNEFGVVRDFNPRESFELSTAAEFLDFLSPVGGRWFGGWGAPWRFRGQSKSSWELRPTVWRDETVTRLLPDVSTLYRQFFDIAWSFATRGLELLPSPHCRSLFERLLLEHYALRDFENLADQSGFLLPTHSMTDIADALREVIAGKHVLDFNPSESLSVAQHHGIPTRLLDWTWNPWFAAYFAASGAFTNCAATSSDERIAVVAVSQPALDRSTNSLVFAKSFEPRRAQNAFMFSQRGLFTYVYGAEMFFLQYGRWPTLDDALKIVFGRIPSEAREVLPHIDDKSAPLFEVTLPVAESLNVLRLLRRADIHRGTLMPSLTAAADSTFEKWRLRFDPSEVVRHVPRLKQPLPAKDGPEAARGKDIQLDE